MCENSEKDSPSRRHFFSVLDSCNSPEDFESFIKEIDGLELERLEYALPCLCDFYERAPKNLSSLLEKILSRYLLDINSTHGGRKASYSCLKEMMPKNASWNAFFVVIESLEEPQFHLIKPILPKVDTLISSLSNEEISFQWISITLIRALLHSNGWIRLWALEKSITLPSMVLGENSNFIFEWIIPALNGNDLFWRLLERNRLESYLIEFGSKLEDIIQVAENLGLFIRQFVYQIEQLSCPASLYFISLVLSRINRQRILKGEDVFPLFRRVLNRAAYIPHVSLRVATCYQFTSFFANMLDWTPEFASSLGKLTSLFSSDSHKIFDRFLQKILPLWEHFPLDINEIMKPHEEDFYKIIMKRISLSDQKPKLLNEVWANFDKAENKDNIIRAYNNELPVTEAQIDKIFAYIRKRISEDADYLILEEVYLPFVNSYKPEGFKTILNDSIEAKEQRLDLRAFLVNGFLQKSEKECIAWLEEHSPVEDYLHFAPIKRDGIPMKEFNVLQTKIQTARLQIYSKINFSKRTPEQDIITCIDLLDCANAFSVKEALLIIISQKISMVDNVSLILSAISSAVAVVHEEKKSQFCLPAIKLLFEICTKKAVLKHAEVEEKAKELFEKFSSTAVLSHPIALALVNILESMEKYLTSSWVKEVLTLAMFGSIPKKENKVLDAAFRIVYSEFAEDLPDSEYERIHELAQRTRLKAICVALRCSDKDENFANCFVEEIIKESNILDKSSSKSFGLSLAHRAKSRAMALLLFVMETVKNAEICDEVFNHCISCILDPCQQFSIKLIVEWIVVRLCLKFPRYKKKLIEMEKLLAVKRIGSISSWINMMVHLARTSSEEEFIKRLAVLIIPWTSAQNFAVRCTAIAGLTLMYNSFSEVMKKENEIIASIINFTSEPSGNSRRIIDNLLGDFYFAHLNMEKDLDLQTAFIEIFTKTGLPQEETIPNSLIKELNKTKYTSFNTNNVFLSAPTLVYSALLKNASSAPEIEMNEEEAISNGMDSIQKKIITKDKTTPEDCSLIVVASLIDKPNNIGGICRTSEIFGVDKLVLADLLVLNDRSFQALSMSSEKWQKFDAVRPEMLLSYLERMRSSGYVVVAAEQSTTSVPLHKFTFPKKCVLLMGEEKEGVPTRLLRAVDQTVEINQLGQTRSLNVHVTAALFIAKYAEQRLL